MQISKTSLVDQLVVQFADHCTQDHLENTICRQRLIAARLDRTPGDSIDHVADVFVPTAPVVSPVRAQVVVEVAQSLSGRGLVSDLEELDADLVRGRVKLLELSGVAKDDALWVVGGASVRDYDDVDGLDILYIVLVLLQVSHVRPEDALQTSTGRGSCGREDGLEEVLDLVGVADVSVTTCGLALACSFSGSVVEKVEVNAVWIVGSTDGSNGGEGIADFSPRATGHGTRVINDKDGIESGQKGISVLCGSDTSTAQRDAASRAAVLRRKARICWWWCIKQIVLLGLRRRRRPTAAVVEEGVVLGLAQIAAVSAREPLVADMS